MVFCCNLPPSSVVTGTLGRCIVSLAFHTLLQVINYMKDIGLNGNWLHDFFGNQTNALPTELSGSVSRGELCFSKIYSLLSGVKYTLGNCL